MPDTTITAERPAETATARPQLPAAPLSGDMMTNPAVFDHMKRVAQVLVASALIPEHLKKNNGADALLALQIARERNENPVSVLQNIYIVSGKAGWSASYMIARANKSGVFKGPIRWRSEGQNDALVVTAVAKMADTGEEVSASASWAMAKAEGWTKNAKYSTMAEHMLRYRSATMLIRLFCPEVMLGMSTVDELEDLRAAGTLRDVTADGHATTAETVGNLLSEPAAQQGAGADGGQADSAADAPAGGGEPVASTQAAAIDGEVISPWRVGDDVVGQDGVIKAIKDLIDKAKVEADVQAVAKENADRTAKMSMAKRDEIERYAANRIDDIRNGI